MQLTMVEWGRVTILCMLLVVYGEYTLSSSCVGRGPSFERGMISRISFVVNSRIASFRIVAPVVPFLRWRGILQIIVWRVESFALLLACHIILHLLRDEHNIGGLDITSNIEVRYNLPNALSPFDTQSKNYGTPRLDRKCHCRVSSSKFIPPRNA